VQVLHALKQLVKERDRYEIIASSKAEKGSSLLSQITEQREQHEKELEIMQKTAERRFEAYSGRTLLCKRHGGRLSLRNATLQEDLHTRAEQIQQLQKEKRELLNSVSDKKAMLNDAEFKLNLAQQDLKRQDAATGESRGLQVIFKPTLFMHDSVLVFLTCCSRFYLAGAGS